MRPVPTRELPERPDMDRLGRQAVELHQAVASGEPEAIAEARRFLPHVDAARFASEHAQLVLARSYGFDSWPKLTAYVDGVTVKRLTDAVRADNVDQVRAILEIRPELVNVVSAWNNEHTALHFAVLGRMPEMVRVLMQLGADARAGISPISEATAAITIARDRGYDEIATIIREEEMRRDAGRPGIDDVPSQLLDALRSGDEAGAIAILERYPDLVHAILREEWTPLHAAAARLWVGMAEWLLDHGADVNRRARHQVTPLDVAGRWCGAAERAARLTAVAELLRAKGAQLTPRAAVILGDVEFLQSRHAEETLSEPLDSDGWLLRLAVDHDRPEILRLLLDFGLDPDARVRVELEGEEEIAFTWGMPLYQCARHGKHAIAELLLERGADPNARVYASGTPLSEAYGQRDERMIALLERFGGRSNASMAGLYRRADLARKLLDEYGDAKLPDDGFSSGTVAEQLLGAAARGGDPEILRMAMERLDWPHADPRWLGALGAPMGFWNHWIGPWCHHEWDRGTYLVCFRMILERCGSVNERMRFGATGLHGVVTMGGHVMPDERVAFAEALLDAGARMHLRDDLLKSTPLGWACRWGREELVRLFLDRGADPRELDAEPWARPLAWAEKKGHHSIAELLRTTAGL